MFLSHSTQGKQLKTLRKHVLKLSQKKFSEAIEIDQGYLSRLENGKNPITHKIINDISDMYNSQNPGKLLNLNWLLLGIGELSIEDNRRLNIDVNNSDNINIGISNKAKQEINIATNKKELALKVKYEKEIAVLTERIKGLENENKSLKEVIKSITSNR